MSDRLSTCGEAGWVEPSSLCCASTGGDTFVDCHGVEHESSFLFTDEEYIKAASDYLYARTCFRYPGICESSFYPCLDCQRCCGHPCGCGPFDAVTLPGDYPINTIVGVLIDGVLLDDDAYHLIGRELVRVDGGAWPRVNGLGLPNASAEDFVVVYESGRTPPILLRQAAAALACDLKAACSGGDCSLPDNVRSVSRRGLSYAIDEIDSVLDAGAKTGIDIVDKALQVYGDCSRMSGFDPAKRRASRGV